MEAKTAKEKANLVNELKNLGFTDEIEARILKAVEKGLFEVKFSTFIMNNDIKSYFEKLGYTVTLLDEKEGTKLVTIKW